MLGDGSGGGLTASVHASHGLARRGGGHGAGPGEEAAQVGGFRCAQAAHGLWGGAAGACARAALGLAQGPGGRGAAARACCSRAALPSRPARPRTGAPPPPRSRSRHPHLQHLGPKGGLGQAVGLLAHALQGRVTGGGGAQGRGGGGRVASSTRDAGTHHRQQRARLLACSRRHAAQAPPASTLPPLARSTPTTCAPARSRPCPGWRTGTGARAAAPPASPRGPAGARRAQASSCVRRVAFRCAASRGLCVPIEMTSLRRLQLASAG